LLSPKVSREDESRSLDRPTCWLSHSRREQRQRINNFVEIPLRGIRQWIHTADSDNDPRGLGSDFEFDSVPSRTTRSRPISVQVPCTVWRTNCAKAARPRLGSVLPAIPAITAIPATLLRAPCFLLFIRPVPDPFLQVLEISCVHAMAFCTEKIFYAFNFTLSNIIWCLRDFIASVELLNFLASYITHLLI